MTSNPARRISSMVDEPTVFAAWCRPAAFGKATRTWAAASPGVGFIKTEMPGGSRVASDGLSRRFSTEPPPIRWMLDNSTPGVEAGPYVLSADPGSHEEATSHANPLDRLVIHE